MNYDHELKHYDFSLNCIHWSVIFVTGKIKCSMQILNNKNRIILKYHERTQ